MTDAHHSRAQPQAAIGGLKYLSATPGSEPSPQSPTLQRTQDMITKDTDVFYGYAGNDCDFPPIIGEGTKLTAEPVRRPKSP